ncbi:CidA/LrgA family protein [Staphylococcus arlettae]
MTTITKSFRIMSQILIIMCITYLGNIIQKALHLPIASSIVGLVIFFLLLKFKVIPEKWIDKGANFLLTTMIFFFIPAVVGLMDVVTVIDMHFILFFVLVIVSTFVVAIISGYVAEGMLSKSNKRGGHD